MCLIDRRKREENGWVDNFFQGLPKFNFPMMKKKWGRREGPIEITHLPPILPHIYVTLIFLFFFFSFFHFKLHIWLYSFYLNFGFFFPLIGFFLIKKNDLESQFILFIFSIFSFFFSTKKKSFSSLNFFTPPNK